MLGYSIDEDGAIVLRSRESLVAFSSPRFAVWGYAANTRVSCEQNDNLIGDNEGSFVCYCMEMTSVCADYSPVSLTIRRNLLRNQKTRLRSRGSHTRAWKRDPSRILKIPTRYVRETLFV